MSSERRNEDQIQLLLDKGEHPYSSLQVALYFCRNQTYIFLRRDKCYFKSNKKVFVDMCKGDVHAN